MIVVFLFFGVALEFPVRVHEVDTLSNKVVGMTVAVAGTVADDHLCAVKVIQLRHIVPAVPGAVVRHLKEPDIGHGRFNVGRIGYVVKVAIAVKQGIVMAS